METRKLKKLPIDHDTDAGRMIEKLVEDYLKICRISRWGLTPSLIRSPYIPIPEGRALRAENVMTQNFARHSK
jgi:hypothetical protein